MATTLLSAFSSCKNLSTEINILAEFAACVQTDEMLGQSFRLNCLTYCLGCRPGSVAGCAIFRNWWMAVRINFRYLKRSADPLSALVAESALPRPCRQREVSNSSLSRPWQLCQGLRSVLQHQNKWSKSANILTHIIFHWVFNQPYWYIFIFGGFPSPHVVWTRTKQMKTSGTPKKGICLDDYIP